MGTWGTGLFGSDSAQDFRDRISSTPLSERQAVLRTVLSMFVLDPDVLWRDLVPEEVLAAAAFVAAGLPLSEDVSWQDEALDLSPPVAPDLPTLALQAVEQVTVAGGWWDQSWVHDEDRVEAARLIAELRRALNSAT